MPRRHELLRVTEDAWRAVRKGHPALDGLLGRAGDLVAGWARNGWPVMARRPMPGDVPGAVPVGLPLPPEYGKLRLAFGLPKNPAPARVAPVLLQDARHVAPDAWRPTICSLLRLGELIGSPPRVFGAVLWQHLTGLNYLHARSDLDLLWEVPDPLTAEALLPVIRRLEEMAPMRLDGEVLLPGGAGVNWRELLDAIELRGGDVLVKTMQGIEIRHTSSLFDRSLS
jgi:phosphoribosyl-dephospho-CoA transferase